MEKRYIKCGLEKLLMMSPSEGIGDWGLGSCQRDDEMMR
jgi:hypothetical protein